MKSEIGRRVERNLLCSCGTSTVCFHSTLRPPGDSARIENTDCFISCRPTYLPFTVACKSLEKVSSIAWRNSSLDDDSKIARTCPWVRDESLLAFSAGWTVTAIIGYGTSTRKLGIRRGCGCVIMPVKDWQLKFHVNPIILLIRVYPIGVLSHSSQYSSSPYM